MTVTPKISEMHKLFCCLTNVREWRLGYLDTFAWATWLREFTEPELRLVVAYTPHFNRRHPGYERKLSFHTMIEQPGKFRQYRDEAETWQRARQAKLRRPTMDRNRAEVLRVTGREDELPLADSRTSAQILHSNSFFEAMRKAVEAGTGGVSA